MSASNESDIQARLDRGVDEFNDGAYFEAHDTLEDVWMDVRGQERLFFQGLIQLAIGYYHLTCQNYPGAEHLLGRGLEKIEPYRPHHRGVGLDGVFVAAHSVREQILARGDEEELSWPKPVIERSGE